MLREPASFIRSLHLELLQDHVETEKDLRKAIERDEAARRNGETDPDRLGLMYSPERVAYVEQLRRFHALFPRENVLVLIYEEFRADNDAAVKEVLRFLGADETFPVDVKDANPTVLVRSPRLYEMVRSLYMGRGRAGAVLKRAVKAVVPRRLRRDALGSMRRHVLYSQPSPPDEELMLELRRRSKAEVEALSEYLGRDLVKLWGYDRMP